MEAIGEGTSGAVRNRRYNNHSEEDDDDDDDLYEEDWEEDENGTSGEDDVEDRRNVGHNEARESPSKHHHRPHHDRRAQDVTAHKPAAQQRAAAVSPPSWRAPQPRQQTPGDDARHQRLSSAAKNDQPSSPMKDQAYTTRQRPTGTAVAASHASTAHHPKSVAAEDLGSLVARHLEEARVHELVSQCIRELSDERGRTLEGVTPQMIKAKLREKGLVEEVLARLNLSDATAVGAQRTGTTGKLLGPQQRQPPRSDRKHLHLSIHGGTAFIEQQDYEDATLQLHIRFRDQRFVSRAYACSCEPAFQEDVFFPLPAAPEAPSGYNRQLDTTFSVRDPVHIVITRQADMHAPKEVIASHHLDWRPLVLESHMNGRVRSKAVKVNGVGASAQLPAGVVHIGVDVTPSSLVNFDAEQVATSLTSEAEARLLLERQFVLLAQRWWDEYAAIRPSHRRRLVKLFASDENATRKPVCVCLQRVKPGRALETPREAARFVSLLPYQRREMSGGLDTGAAVRWEQWSSTHAFLCAGQGDVEDHALLLVGLLLEFGLNAFICLGTKQCEEEGDDDEQFTGESAYAWAMVPADDGIIWFWDPITGKQHQHWRVHDHQRFGEQPNHPFVTVDCVFNETLFAANAQPSNHVQDCSFDLSNESDWKRLSSDVVLDLRQHHAASQPITLQSIPLDVHAASEMLEREFRALIKEHRRHIGLSTRFDASLEQTLSPALVSYELENTHGVAVGNQEFKAAIKHMIPTGHSFKGFPFEMRTLNAGEALRECMSSFVGQDILDAHGDQVWHAVRCRVYTYPENVIVVWMMLACRYLTVST